MESGFQLLYTSNSIQCSRNAHNVMHILYMYRYDPISYSIGVWTYSITPSTAGPLSFLITNVTEHACVRVCTCEHRGAIRTLKHAVLLGRKKAAM